MPQSKTLWIRLSFAVSIVLLVLKFYAFYITKSTAILTDALESIVNVVSAAFASYSIYLSSLPRDENHPYGHGKVEFFSAGVEGVLIMLAGIFILYQAVYNLFFPEELENLREGMLLIGFSGLVNGALGFALQRKGKALNSITLEASGKHLLVDTLTSVLLLLGIGLILLTGFQFLDSVIAILFSMYIGYSGYGLVRRSVGGSWMRQMRKRSLLRRRFYRKSVVRFGSIFITCACSSMEGISISTYT
ncbi:cation diffusion facilitator family transporter [Nitritalea halalkaliphila]|uniref:cation diffusion facilitator family transporter n=1 Tax=Nitritalea halalkaliphila TaxID=590849 RepID=UPI0002EC49E2|nr:cation diffusion facilitator family transporter [Nitritalea halalkaliphila]